MLNDGTDDPDGRYMESFWLRLVWRSLPSACNLGGEASPSGDAVQAGVEDRRPHGSSALMTPMQRSLSSAPRTSSSLEETASGLSSLLPMHQRRARIRAFYCTTLPSSSIQRSAEITAQPKTEPLDLNSAVPTLCGELSSQYTSEIPGEAAQPAPPGVRLSQTPI
eukprot:6174303-Pleurochrysis_carterae.AAC.2